VEDLPIAKLHSDLLWETFVINMILNLPEVGEVFGTYNYHSPCPNPAMSKWTVVDIVQNQLRKILDLAQGALVTARPVFGVKTVEFM
jgi:hypothetical protein